MMNLISILLVVSYVGTAIWKLRALPKSFSSLVWLFDGGSSCSASYTSGIPSGWTVETAST